MNEKDYMQIDELLSAFLDDELSQRQHTEIKRLILNDAHIAGKLEQLRMTRKLVSALPREAAPVGLLDDVRASLERSSLLDVGAVDDEERAGLRGLLLRRSLSVAAVLVLFGVLAVLVYTIVRPYGDPQVPMVAAVEPKVLTEVVEPVPDAEEEVAVVFASAVPVMFTLEISTEHPLAANASIHRAIYDNNLLSAASPPDHSTEDVTVYRLRCGEKNAQRLLADLRQMWDSSENVSLAVNTETIGEHVVVDNVSFEQVADLLGGTGHSERVETARKFAAINNIEKSIIANDVTAGSGKGDYGAYISRPVLTTGERKPANEQANVEQGEAIALTIMVLSR